ncbi:MAG: peptide chain release factor N(5)-glutamine methyltransferase [Clostridia bacterium]|nr:peptide chain release factor N(5)-glutamine methyltransferase [Clostridia bacterium]
MVKLKSLRRASVEKLISAENDSPTADVDSILLSLGFSKSDIIIGEKEITPKAHENFQNALERLLAGEPVQYIVGGCEFMSLWFKVNSSTLIPRCDTEILVEQLIEKLNGKAVNILDIGTGSGCIAISLAHYLPKSKVLSVDISGNALKTAKENALLNKVDSRCNFEKCDIMNQIPNFLPDVIVSNPPYIPSQDIDSLDRKVKDFEPLSALIGGGEDGLDFYRRISADMPLSPKGILAFEVGIGQAADVAEIMSRRFENIEIKKDLSGIDRTVMGNLK